MCTRVMDDFLRLIFQLKNKGSFITRDLFLNMLKLIIIDYMQYMI